jgi:hypothetical protein
MSQWARLTRDVAADETGWLPRAFAKGEILFTWTGDTNDVIGPGQVALTEQADQGPPWAFPSDAVRLVD